MNWSYLFKHWFATLLIGPLIAQLYGFLTTVENQIFNSIEIVALFILFGFFSSLPTYLIYSIIYRLLHYKKATYKLSKAILISVAVAGIVITFWSIGGSLSFRGMICYSIASILSGIYFKLNFKAETK